MNLFEVPALTSPPPRGWNLELYTEKTLPPLCCCWSGNFIMATEMEPEQSVLLGLTANATLSILPAP